MQTTILFNTPMRVNSIFQSASVIEFQEHGNIHNTMFVRLDVEPYAPHIVCATDRNEYIAVTIDKSGTVYGTTTDCKRVPLTKTPYSTPESATLTQVGECGSAPATTSTLSIKQKSISYTRRLYLPPV